MPSDNIEGARWVVLWCAILRAKKISDETFLWNVSVGDHVSLLTSKLKTSLLLVYFFNSKIKYSQDATALISDLLRIELKIEYQSQKMLIHWFKEH